MATVYKTRQRQAVLEYIKKFNDRQFSALQIAEGVKDEGIGKSTVYRQISYLLEEGLIRRFRGKDGKSVLYQYTGDVCCRDHFHLKCKNCGKLVHLDCKHIEHLRHHIMDEHEFTIDMLSTVLYGFCKECKKGSEENL